MKKALYLLLLLTVTLSCNEKLFEGGPYIEVYIEDSPAEFESLSVRLESVEILQGAGWIKLKVPAQNIQIMDLTGGKSKLLVSQEVRQGTYSAVRFTFAAEGHKLNNGGTDILELAVDEHDQVVELPLNINAEEGKYYIMCDMDVAKSVNEQELKLYPSLSLIDLSTAGIIRGAVAPPNDKDNIDITLIEFVSESGIRKSTYTQPQTGNFFIRLQEGMYTVNVSPKEESPFRITQIDDVAVQMAQPTELGKIRLEEKPILDVNIQSFGIADGYKSFIVELDSVEVMRNEEWVKLKIDRQSLRMLEYSDENKRKLLGSQHIREDNYTGIRLSFAPKGHKLTIGTEKPLDLTIDEDNLSVELSVDLSIIDGRYFINCGMDLVRSVDVVNLKLKPDMKIVKTGISDEKKSYANEFMKLRR